MSTPGREAPSGGEDLRGALGRAAYGALFVVVLPVALVAWARVTEDVVPLNAVHRPVTGWVVAGVGMAAILASMLALRVWGKGLPMNAFPPPLYVRRGPYRVTRHPIYVGFGLLCAGVALALGSASGLWLVTPIVVLAMAALVLGYEGPDLARRFGAVAAAPPLVSLTLPDTPGPTVGQRVAVFLLVFLPWALAYEAVYLLGVPPDALEAYLPVERGWPVLVWTEAVYASTYLYVGLVPVLVGRSDVLRRFAVRGLFATAVVILIYLTVPVVAPPRPFTGGGWLGRMLLAERAMSNTVAAFPAFHVLWALFAAEAWSHGRRRVAPWAWIWAGAIAVSCITTGMHALADVALALLLWPVLRTPEALWRLLRRGAEGVANSWREWRVGPVRILVYGFYGGLAGGLGFWITASLAGPGELGGAVVLLVMALAGAGLWAQKLEGSSALSRPFGYFGSLVGGTAGAAAAGLMGYDTSLLFAAVAASAPWVQAVGRFRCLVQGCCHGREAPASVGIQYLDRRSRVCSLGGLQGVPLHPTPLYSILANLVTGVVLARLWSLGASEGIVIGLYLLLAGLTRFVEESYRGEPQTPTVGGLRLYQWLALVIALVGAVVTTVAEGSVPGTGLSLAGPIVAGAGAYAALCLFALGVDFPDSDRRYARLAPVD